MSPNLFGNNYQALNNGLDFSVVKNRIITSNIANVETPGYKSFRVVMDEQMTKSANVAPGQLNRTHAMHSSGSNSHATRLARTHSKHISGSSSGSSNHWNIVRDDKTTMRTDGNNVDIDSELSELSANAIYYTAISRFINKKFSGLRAAISEGKR